VPRLLAAVTSTSTDTPFKGVDDFFGSSLFSAIVRLLAIFAIALWLALVFWTAKDARRRIDDPWIVAVCIAAAVLFGPVAVIIYLILRPPEYLDDVRERELEIRAMERRLGAEQVCPYCRNPVDASFLSCPYCATKLKNACRRCKSPLDPAWRLCPYCETSVGALPAPTRTSRTEPTRSEA
jgi:uncharacterized Zn-finger protein